MRRALAVLSFVVLPVPAAMAQIDAYDSFRLYNSCRPMNLLIEEFTRDERKIGLSKNGFRVAAESRLRAARIYSEDRDDTGGAYLYVRTLVIDRSFMIEVKYKKRVTDEFETSAPTTTRERGFSGMQDRDPSYIMSSLSELLDEFLASYLRVNEAACD